MTLLRFRCGVTGGIDLGLMGLLADGTCGPYTPAASNPFEGLLTGLEMSDLFQRLETNDLQLAVVTLEAVLDYVFERPLSSVRVLGSLLGGDCRALVTLCAGCQNAQSGMLGAADPEAAFARWEDISHVRNSACSENRAEKIAQHHLPLALSRGRYSVLEVNLFWEGLLGCRRGLIRSAARAGEHGIPLGASHVLLTNQDTLRKRSEQLMELRQKLVSVYENFLKDSDQFVERWAASVRFSAGAESSFLQASARVLAPHCEEFLRTSGRLSQKVLQPFIGWYHERVLSRKGRLRKSDKALFSHFEQFFCDLWA